MSPASPLRSPRLAPLSLTALLLVPALASAGWRVTPIRIDLDPRTKTGTVKVVNEDPAPRQMQVTVSHWTQDETGADVYEDSDDLVYFPRILVLPGNEERLVRAGYKVPATDVEHAYRLFIEEIPEAQVGGAGVGVTLRFGVPVFSVPISPAPKGRVDDLRLEGGELRFTVVNTGNVHFKMDNLQASGLDDKGAVSFESSIAGWYLLPGASRAYAIPLDPAQCSVASKLELLVAADVLKLYGDLPVSPAGCAP